MTTLSCGYTLVRKTIYKTRSYLSEVEYGSYQSHYYDKWTGVYPT